MRTFPLAATALLFALAGYALAQADPAPVPIPDPPKTTIHIDLTPKEGTAIANKMAVGDKCTITAKLANNLYTVTVKDTTPAKSVTAPGTLEETATLANVDLKKLSKVNWTIAEGDKTNNKDVIVLTTTDPLPTK